MSIYKETKLNEPISFYTNDSGTVKKSMEVAPTGVVSFPFGLAATPTVVTGAVTAKKGERLVLINTAPVTVTLPLNPVVGDQVELYDGKANWDVYNVTVDRNAQLLNGATSNLVLNIKRSNAVIIFVGGTEGWAKYPSTEATFA